MGSNKSSSNKLKDRLARMFRPASLLRSSCNPSTSSAAAAAVSAANTSSRALLADVAHDPVFVPNTPTVVDSDRNDLGRSLSVPITDDRRGHRTGPLPPISLDCGGCRPHHRDAVPPPLIVKNAKRSSNSSTCKNTKVERRVRENGGFYETGGAAEGRTCPPVSPSSPSKTFSASRNYCYYNHQRCFNEAKLEDLKKTKKKKKKKKKLLLTNSYGFTSSSSMESDDGNAFFSSEEEEGEEAAKREEETETFFSSKSFSSDSSEFYRRPLPKPRNNKNTKEKEEKSRGRRRRRVGSSCNGCNVKEGFRPMVSVAANKEITKKKGFAVVKRSSDPYADFRASMVEMIVERQIFGADDLERLLQSYLSLNSPRHHPVILQAFSDIWVALFGN